MFSFFPISILWKVCSQPRSSFRNHRLQLPLPSTRFTQGLSVSLSLLCTVDRPPKYFVTFRPVQECLCLFMRATKISCCWTRDQKTQDMCYYLCLKTMIIICSDLERISLFAVSSCAARFLQLLWDVRLAVSSYFWKVIFLHLYVLLPNVFPSFSLSIINIKMDCNG